MDSLHPANAARHGHEAAERGDRDVGAALRAAYQRTVEEAIPDEMIDLLGKLS